jgi:hypothetical protein
VFQAEMSIDGQAPEKVALPTTFTTRRLEPFWKY